MSVYLCMHLLIPISIHMSTFLGFFVYFKQADCHRQEKCSQAPSENAICHHGNGSTGRQRGPVELSRLKKPCFAPLAPYLISDQRGSSCWLQVLPPPVRRPSFSLFLFCSETNGHRRGHICQQHRSRVIYRHGESERSFPLLKPLQLLPLPTGKSRGKRRWPDSWINLD